MNATAPPPSLLARLPRFWLIVLAVLAALPYVNGLTGDFTYDDKLIIRDNPRLRSPSSVGEIFTTHYFGGPLATGTAYRPVVLLTYAVQRWVHGSRAIWFHVVNVALHSATTVLLAAWLVAVGFPRGPSVASAAVFAVLPIHVEAVTGVVGRAEVLAALLVLAAALLWRRATGGTRLDRGAYAGCLAAFTVAVFVKENAVALPGVVGLGELFREGRGGAPAERVRELARRRGAAFLGLLAPVGVLFGVRRLVLKGFLISKEAGIFELENPLVALKPALRVANAAFLMLRYVAKTALPVGLAADHSAHALPLAAHLAEPRALLGLAGVVALLSAALLLWKVRPLAAFGAVLFLGTFLPTANILFPIGTIYAERLMYLPSAGLVCLAVGLLAPPHRAVPRPVRLPWREVALLSAVAAYAAATLARNRVWRDDFTLYSDMLAKMPNSAKAHYNFAYDAQRSGRPRDARTHLERAVAIFPRYYDAWAMLGKIAWDEKRWEDAIASYRRSVEIFPHYENGRWGLAKTLQESGRKEEAAKAYRDGISEFPDSYPLAFHHAGFLAERGRLLDSEKEWVRAIAAGKGAALARLEHAKVLVKVGREAEGWDEARRALVADRSLAAARLFLAERYELAGKTLGAAMELTRAYHTAPGDAAVAARVLEFGQKHPETRGRASTCLAAIRERFGERPKDEALSAVLASYGHPRG